MLRIVTAKRWEAMLASHECLFRLLEEALTNDGLSEALADLLALVSEYRKHSGQEPSPFSLFCNAPLLEGWSVSMLLVGPPGGRVLSDAAMARAEANFNASNISVPRVLGMMVDSWEAMSDETRQAKAARWAPLAAMVRAATEKPLPPKGAG